MKVRSIPTFSSIIIVALALMSCVSGPKFATQNQTAIPDNKALVYIYRAPYFVGAAVSFDVYANGQKVINLKNGGYYPYICDPGNIEFTAKTETRTIVSEYIAASKVYYLKGFVVMGAFIGEPVLKIVAADDGKKEILDCHLLTP